MPNPKDAKDPEEIREPQRDEEADIDETKLGVARDVDDQELAEDEIMEELYEDDLRAMEGPDA